MANTRDTAKRSQNHAAHGPTMQHISMKELSRRGPWGETKWKEEIKKGELRAFRIGLRRLVVTEEDYQDYIARNLQPVLPAK